jgi:two-component system chemotaxis sensor kinase CheA
VLNFAGRLLPVEDTGGILGVAAEIQNDATGADGTQIIVVVCRDGDRHVGIVVSHVLDVAAGTDLFEAGTGVQTGGVTMLKERVTGVVDLGSLAPLAHGEPAHEQWAQSAEVMA